MEAISREGYLAFAGLKKTAELQPIYKQYERILGEEALELTLEMFRSERENSEEKRSAQNLLEWEIESQASKPLAELDEREIEWENSAVIRSPDGRVIQSRRAIGSRTPRSQNARLAWTAPEPAFREGAAPSDSRGSSARGYMSHGGGRD